MPQSEKERAEQSKIRGKAAASQLTKDIEKKRPGYTREFIALQGDIEASQGYRASTREEERKAAKKAHPWGRNK